MHDVLSFIQPVFSTVVGHRGSDVPHLYPARLWIEFSQCTMQKGVHALTLALNIEMIFLGSLAHQRVST